MAISPETVSNLASVLETAHQVVSQLPPELSPSAVARIKGALRMYHLLAKTISAALQQRDATLGDIRDLDWIRSSLFILQNDPWLGAQLQGVRFSGALAVAPGKARSPSQTPGLDYPSFIEWAICAANAALGEATPAKRDEDRQCA